MAEILPFTGARSAPAETSRGVAATLRRNIGQLSDAASALRRSRDNLSRHHDLLAGVRAQLLVQVDHARAIALLADAVEQAVAVGDLPTMLALQAEIVARLDAAPSHAGTPQATDAAD